MNVVNQLEDWQTLGRIREFFYEAAFIRRCGVETLKFIELRRVVVSVQLAAVAMFMSEHALKTV